MLELTDVTRRFGSNVAVDAVSLSIPEGQMVGVIGRSGAGKSTLLRMINRLTPSSSGEIRFKGKTVSGLTGRRAAQLAARLRHDLPAVQPGAAARRADQRASRSRLNHRSTLLNILNVFTVEERASALRLERLGIAQTAMQMAGTLSGGQQQRVAIARA
jgi:phosphonate transport system ATP-binding protein